MNHVTLSEAVDMIVPRDEWFAGAVFRESGVKVAGNGFHQIDRMRKDRLPESWMQYRRPTRATRHRRG